MGSPNEIRSEKVLTLSKFVSLCDGQDLFHLKAPLFRGQGKRRNLLPSICRDQPEVLCVERERKMLRQFRLQGASLLTPKLTDLELLVVAQHFGMKTRLLDWSTNPLAALWFACTSRQAGDVYVYVLDADTFQDEDIYEEDPFSHAETLVFQPRLDNPRVLAQNGWFSLHRYSHSNECFVPLENQSQMRDKLSEWVIPGPERMFILNTLSRMGVDDRTMYPGLEGLGRSLNNIS